MAVSTADMNQIRVDVLGASVDQATSWTTAPPANANTLNTPDRVPNRAINSLATSVTNALAGTNGFAGRFNDVIGEEAAGDQTAWNSIGSNLIQAVAALAAGGVPGGGAAPQVFPIATASAVWTLPHNCNFLFVSIMTFDTAGNWIIGDPNFVDVDNATVTFSQPVSGTAIVRK